MIIELHTVNAVTCLGLLTGAVPYHSTAIEQQKISWTQAGFIFHPLVSSATVARCHD